MPITVLPLTADRMPDLDAVFQAKGCSIAKQCHCMYYRRTGKGPSPAAGEPRWAPARRAIAELSKGDMPPGLIGYLDGKPAGWVSLGPRADYARLANSPTMRAVDDKPVWSVICFVVPSAYRKQGVVDELLAAAVAFARDRGVTLLEAYPVDRDVPGASHAPWFGSLAMFRRAGFEEVARHKPARPIVRLAIRARTKNAKKPGA
jgi:ribosomal protein S18 acetylase RimI-like enzyme